MNLKMIREEVAVAKAGWFNRFAFTSLFVPRNHKPPAPAPHTPHQPSLAPSAIAARLSLIPQPVVAAEEFASASQASANSEAKQAWLYAKVVNMVNGRHTSPLTDEETALLAKNGVTFYEGHRPQDVTITPTAPWKPPAAPTPAAMLLRP